MNTIEFSEGISVHFIGIGGISMSGLAEILIKNGCNVSGSDIKSSRLTDKLSQMGALIHIGQRAENITDPNLVVYSAAIKPDNSEYMAAKSKGLVMCDRATLLGKLMKSYAYPVAVSGTHGKTTTTSMLTHILLEAGLDPTVLVGGNLAAIGGNIRVGNDSYFVCEACEYHQSFLRFFPLISIILNIEADHLDYFRDLDHIIETFRELALLTPDHGAVVVNADDENVKKAVLGISKNIVTYSMESQGARISLSYHYADFIARNIQYDSQGLASFDLYERGKFEGSIKMSVPGAHNVSNALGAIAAARFLGVEFNAVTKGLLSFVGAGRRFEYLGERGGVTVIDDYAHHPTEIGATLKSARTPGNIWCVFQPHTYTRTNALFDDFVRVLTGDVRVIVLDIYAARERDTGLVSAHQLAKKIPGAVYLPDFSQCVKYLEENTKSGDMIITMGAGDVYEIGRRFLED